MLFKISRTSRWNEKPCEEAFVKSFVEFDKLFSDSEDNEDVWVIKINSLKDLVTFIQKYGKCVISEDEIEIYDTWRE